MTQDVYADILFVINFCFDIIALYITAKLLTVRIRKARFIISATIGACYSVVSLFLPDIAALNFILILAVPFLMCASAFRFSSVKSTLSSFIVYFLISSMIGGILSALYRIVNNLLRENGITYETIEKNAFSLRVFLVVLLFAVALISVYLRITANIHTDGVTEVEIQNGGMRVIIDGFIDTGNMLSDPVSGSKAIVVPHSAIEAVLPRELNVAVEDPDISAIKNLSVSLLLRTKLIPATSVAGNILLLGYKPDKITIRREVKGKIREKDTNALIAIMPSRIEQNSNDAVIPSALIKTI